MEELICLIMGADLLVCLDSGPMHLAQTLGVPVVALFGPGDFELWCPRGERDEVIFHRLPCNPCLQERCVRSGDSCMTMITVEEVFTAVKKVLDLKTDLCEK
jgi:ADP-heptose:LPS heptosyltransferase